jgi:hypothetical protein
MFSSAIAFASARRKLRMPHSSVRLPTATQMFVLLGWIASRFWACVADARSQNVIVAIVDIILHDNVTSTDDPDWAVEMHDIDFRVLLIRSVH